MSSRFGAGQANVEVAALDVLYEALLQALAPGKTFSWPIVMTVLTSSRARACKHNGESLKPNHDTGSARGLLRARTGKQLRAVEESQARAGTTRLLWLGQPRPNLHCLLLPNSSSCSELHPHSDKTDATGRCYKPLLHSSPHPALCPCFPGPPRPTSTCELLSDSSSSSEHLGWQCAADVPIG